MKLIVDFVFFFGGLRSKRLCNLAWPDHVVEVNEMIGVLFRIGFTDFLCLLNRNLYKALGLTAKR